MPDTSSGMKRDVHRVGDRVPVFPLQIGDRAQGLGRDKRGTRKLHKPSPEVGPDGLHRATTFKPRRRASASSSPTLTDICDASEFNSCCVIGPGNSPLNLPAATLR